jgi:hypothetical protein
MNFLIQIIIGSLIFLLPYTSLAQENTKDKAPATSQVQKKAAKKKWKEQRKMEMEHEKAVKKHHKRLQQKKTLKTMRKEKQKGEKLRKNKREFFLVRWFKNRHH